MPARIAVRPRRRVCVRDACPDAFTASSQSSCTSRSCRTIYSEGIQDIGAEAKRPHTKSNATTVVAGNVSVLSRLTGALCDLFCRRVRVAVVDHDSSRAVGNDPIAHRVPRRRRNDWLVARFGLGRMGIRRYAGAASRPRTRGHPNWAPNQTGSSHGVAATVAHRMGALDGHHGRAANGSVSDVADAGVDRLSPARHHTVSCIAFRLDNRRVAVSATHDGLRRGGAGLWRGFRNPPCCTSGACGRATGPRTANRTARRRTA